MQSCSTHTPVLLAEVIAALNIRPEGIYLDATFGRGGHAQAILDRLGPQGKLYAFDRDAEAVSSYSGQDPRLILEHCSFADLQGWLAKKCLAGKLQGILMDLGVSSPQLDNPERGFSFTHDGPLDMRMDTTQQQTAATWLNAASYQEIVTVLRQYGEEKFSGRIAAAIISARQNLPFSRTGQLAHLIAATVPRKEPGKHPATRSFQAIRIYINRELESLERALPTTLSALAPLGRLAVISFHSLEDRIVKRFMRKHARGDDFPKNLPITADKIKPLLRIVGKAVGASNEEVVANVRSRSAVLRVAERIH